MITIQNLPEQKLSDLFESVLYDLERAEANEISINMSYYSNSEFCTVCLGGAAVCGFMSDYSKDTLKQISEEATSVKMRFKDDEDFVETPWGAKSPDGKEYALLNHALAFTPALSWGAIFDNTNVMFTPILEKQELTLHPEAYDYYEKEGVIDKEGNYTPKPES